MSSVNLENLRQFEWERRKEVIRIPEMRQEGEKEDPTWEIIAPSANDLSQSNSAKDNREKTSILLSGVTRSKMEQIEEVKETLGLTDDVTPDIARRVSLLVNCSVNPKCAEDSAVWLAEFYPVVFYHLTNRILELGGSGGTVKKSQ